jgi:hypothetical protein
MTIRSLLRASAVAAGLSGLLWIVGWTLDIERDSLMGAVLVLVAYVLAVFAFMGLYAIQYSRAGILGALGFVLVVVANVLFVPFVFIDIARASVAPEIDRELIETTAPTLTIGMVAAVSFMLGFALFGVATIRARVLSRWPAVVLVVAALMPAVYPLHGVGKLLARVGGVALLGLGWSLWSRASVAGEEATEHMP